MPTLHGHPLSPYVRKVLIALAEKGIGYDHNPVMHFALPDGFEKLHPLRKIPVWTTDKGENIPDSSVIIAYLDKVAPEPRLIPEDPVPFARALFLEEFADSAFSMAIATIFLEKFAAPLVLGKPTNEELVGKVLDRDLPPLFAHLDETIGHRDFMVGDSLTVADVAIASPLSNFRHTGLEIDASSYPNLRRYADAIVTRPTIAKLFAAEVAEYGGNSPEAAAAQ
jgi:glutathione S-transferase